MFNKDLRYVNMSPNCLHLHEFKPIFLLDLHPHIYDRLYIMVKVWIYKRKNINGWWVGWYESNQRRAKALPTKVLADHYRQIKYTQLNSDVFTGTVIVDWLQMTEEYYKDKKVEGLTESSIYEISLTLRNFQRLTPIRSSKQLTQHNIDEFILKRGKEVKRTTLNKDIRNMKAFTYWCHQKKYTNGSLKIKLLKEEERPVKSLNEPQIKKLMLLATSSPTVYLRILLALGTGLRRGDIESLRISDIDFINGNLATKSQKTKKSMASRPLPLEIVAELKVYVENLPKGQELLFTDKFKHRKWKEMCKKIELPDLKFHDLRRTFASILAQRGVSTAVTQRLLEHSSPTLTQKIYTNVDPVLRQSINQLPVIQWLSK
jgi:integrase